MARNEQDREDLMREATALTRRIELQLPDEPDPWVVGFRRGGEASVFVGADPVFQFNDRNELRRSFWNGKLLKAENGRLVQLDRRRTDSEVQLLRTELTTAESHEFLTVAKQRLDQLQQVISDDTYAIVAQVPPDLAATTELQNWLAQVPDPLVVAAVPNVNAQR